jgi:hypothetical protein
MMATTAFHLFQLAAMIRSGQSASDPLAEINGSWFVRQMLAAFQFALVAILAVPASLITAVLALLAKRSRIASRSPHTTLIIVGTVVPSLMLARGLQLSWPWPWYQPQTMQDGIPPGPWLLMAALPSWAVCLAVVRFVVRR